MRVVGLVSGGKDSCFNLLHCVAAGHELVAVANLRPRAESVQEMDSHMFQTVGWNNVDILAEVLGLPLYVECTDMVAKHVDKDYVTCEGDEVEDLYKLLAKVQADTGAEGVGVGAILSDYQRVRVENVCLRLGLTSLAFLWRRDQAELLREMIDVGMKSVLVKVACLGLEERHLGLELSQVEEDLTKLSAKFGVNVCGEGGEFETFTLDCPLFRKKLVVRGSHLVKHSQDAFAPVCLLLLDLNSEGEGRLGSHSELLGSSLMERLCPMQYAAPFTDLANEVGLPDVSLQVLDLSQTVLSFNEENHGWFTVKGIPGSGEDCALAVNEAFIALSETLDREGADLEMIVKITMYVDSMLNYQSMNAAYITHFGVNPPVRVCVALEPRFLPGNCRLVLEVLGQRQGRGSVLHVQGVSHWAPANIGPYSQGVLSRDRLCVSGQIGLVPGSMQLVSGEAAQAGLALRHTHRVAQALLPGLTWSQVREVTCYVLGQEGARQAQSQWIQAGGTSHVTYRLVAQLPRTAAVEWEVTYNHTLAT